MPTGDVKGHGNAKKSLCLIAGATATNGQPSAATDGVPVYPVQNAFSSVDTGLCYTAQPCREATIFVKVVGSGGTVSATLRLWGYLTALGEWVPIGIGGDTTKGLLNAGSAIGETKTDKALHCEAFNFAGHFDRLYLEVVSISGTSATVESWIVSPRTVSY